MKKLKILMSGFGKGSNIKIWLDYFQRTKQFDVFFICKKFEFDKLSYNTIHIYEYKSYVRHFIPLISNIRKHYVDILYIHGLYDPLFTYLVLFFARADIKILNIWGEKMLKKAIHFSLKYSILYNAIFKKVDFINFTWFGTLKIFGENFTNFKDKTELFPWGINFTELESGVSNKFLKQYINKLNKDDIFLFWPEWIAKTEYIHLLIEAIILLKNELDSNIFDRLKVLIFSGTQKEKNSYAYELEKMINENDINETITIKVGDFVSTEDIYFMWNRANVSVKFSCTDQLSNGIIEALYFKTPVILNDRYSYRKLKDFGLEIFLAKLNSYEIAEKMKAIILSLIKDPHFFDKTGERNKAIILEKFDFNKNVTKMFEYYNSLLEKR